MVRAVGRDEDAEVALPVRDEGRRLSERFSRLIALLKERPPTGVGSGMKAVDRTRF